MLRKVKLKDEIFDKIYSNGICTKFNYMPGLHITYPPEFCKTRYFFIDFDKPYPYYDGMFEIMEPEELEGFIVFEGHIEYCCPIDIQLEDTLFDL